MTTSAEAAVEMDYERRFGGVARLYGAQAFERIQQASVCVVGIGGVGSWVAEALARSAVGRITLIDLDHVAESNVNRQIQALESHFGQAKIEAMAARIREINPRCVLTLIDDFLTLENLDQYLGNRFDVVIDAIDSARVKAAMIAWCKRHKIPLLASGGAGGRVDPSRLVVNDLAHTMQDPLLSRVRTLLRRDHGLPLDRKKKFGVECVYSLEPLQHSSGTACDVGAGPVEAAAGLNCTGYGSAMTVTAAFAMLLAARALNRIAKEA